MTKKILCKVVRSVPLAKSSVSSLHASQSDNRRPTFSDVVAGTPNAPYCVWEPAVDVRVRHTGNSVTYTNRLDVARVCIDDGLTGQLLDCYV